MKSEEIRHLAFSILHGTFDLASSGGCSCPDCSILLDTIHDLCREEAASFYDEHYPPPGGLI
jgi:hypothetical protein